MKSRRLIYILSLLGLASCSSQHEESSTYSFRALSIPSEDVIWAAASEGLVIRSMDAGLTWDTLSVPGYVGEFRDIHAWNAQSAVVMGIASPGIVFKTNDGGITWREVYQQTDEATFFDQMDFNDNGGGMIWGDPIDEVWNIIGTNDFGEHWVRQMNNTIKADSGDVSFAASGSALIVNDSNYISFTGGYGGKMHSYKPRTSTSLYTDTSSTSGVYSATQLNDSTIVFVGGDYRYEDLTRNACGLVYMDGPDFRLEWPEEGIRGYRSCVVTVRPNLLISCGPTGMDWSNDGLVWHPLNDNGANVLAVSPKTNRVWAAGKGGIWEVSLPEDAKLGTN